MDTPSSAQLLAEVGVVAFDLRGRLVSIERRHPQTGVETALIELRPGEADVLMPAERDTRALALAAAQQTSDALAELVRHAADGPSPDGPWSREGEDTVELLADALKLAMEIEGDELAETERAQLYAALVSFLEGWR